MPALKIPRYDDDCALCRVAKADKTGSHLAPNFLVHGAFSFDGKGGRFREIVTRDNLNTQSRWLFYGQEVSPEAISADRGRCLTDEELEGNINVLECDNLFWLSVFWRMGVGRMSIFLDGEDEFAMREIAPDSINTYKEPEVLVNEISLEEFARLKRFVLDESLEAGWGRLSEMVKLDCRERDRSSGKLHSVEKEAELIEAARLVDGELGRPELLIRNLDVFFFGDVKRHWFARKGEEYDILGDENIMIFPFDIEKFVDMLEAQGYTDNDIRDNLRSRENE